ncbi:MAG: metal-dependent hydrolase [Planctomycetia bacterium]|nr:metal-dependent hydrolase [Planctomycetia bacterium]
MTTIEHAMLGISGVLATGLYRPYGWQLCGAAAVAAVLPDWDGLTFLGGMTLFDSAHRAWGHGLLSCCIVGIMWALLDCRYDFISRGVKGLLRLTRVEVPESAVICRTRPTTGDYLVWLAVVLVAVLSHPFADMLVSGAPGLSDWEIKIFWPFSDVGWVFPMVPWGDIGVSVLFFAGMFLMVWRKKQIQWTAGMTLALVAIYMVIRGFLR